MLAVDSDPKDKRKLRVQRSLTTSRPRRRNTVISKLLKGRRLSEDREGAELLEFALALPLILVMVAGLLDFANAYNIKQKLANAAREGARLGAAEPYQDINNPTPASVTNIYQDVITYLQNAGVNTSFIGGTLNYSTTTETGTYYSTGTYGLKIERWVQITNADSNGTTIPATRVTLTYPYDWSFGFNHIIDLLVPSANIAGTVTITTDAMMPNQ